MAARGQNVGEDIRESGAVFTYELTGALYAVSFWGKAAKPNWHYRFQNEERRAAKIAEFWQSIEARATFKADQKTKGKERAVALAGQLAPGTVLHGSWGYDQTNAEIFEVVERRGMAVWIRPLCCESVPGSAGFMSESIRPTPGKYAGPAIKRLIGAYGVKLHAHCSLTPTSPTTAHYSSWYA